MTQLMTAAEVSSVEALEDEALKLPQVSVEMLHTFHAGLYARTAMVPAGVVITGALIKIPTLLIISGSVIMYGAGGSQRLDGYNVIQGAAGRKQAFFAETDVWMTMIFPSEAKDEIEAELEFTEDVDRLATRRADLEVVPCQE
jgi:hypothetical protein